MSDNLWGLSGTFLYAAEKRNEALRELERSVKDIKELRKKVAQENK